MPDVNVKGRYRIYTHDGVSPLLFTSYSTSLCSIRRPNPNTFITISTYIPGSLSPFTTFDPGSSYTIVTRSNTADFSIGPYVRADRLPSSVRFRSPNFYHGLDKNSITVALSSYALSVNAPLSTVFTYIPNQDGFFVNSVSFNTARYLDGLPSLLTHLTPNSSYQFINRTPFTFFAPLESEMGDTWAIGSNSYGQYGMGHLHNLNLHSYRQLSYITNISAAQMYGNWMKIVERRGSVMALSACGTKNKLFVCGDNANGELGLGHNSSVSVFTNVPHPAGSQFGWKDICPGAHSFVIDEFNEIYASGNNDYGQLGLGNSGAGTSRNVFTKVPGFTTGTREVSFASTGLYHSLIRDTNGNLWSCGYNTSGQLGLGDTNQRNTFTLVQNIGNGDVGAGGYASAYVSNNRMYACGYNSFTPSNYSYLNSRIGVSNSEVNSIYTTFTQEANGFTDIQNLWIGGRGIFVRRSSSNVLWACGTNGWGGLGMPVSNIKSGTQYVDLDIRTLRPTIIPSNAYKFLPAMFTGSSAFSRAYPYWIDNSTFELKTIVQSSAHNGTETVFTPYAVGTGLYVSKINDNTTGNVFCSTLFHNRGPLPSPTPMPSPTPTPTSTPITLVPSVATNAIINAVRTQDVRSQGDKLWWYYSSDNFISTNRTYWAALQSSMTVANINVFQDTCYDFKDNDNLVIATMVKDAQNYYRLLKQTVRNRTTWGVEYSLNDIGTNSTTIATWNNASYDQPFFTPGKAGNGKIDMFVHRNSNTAVYAFTQIGTASQTYSDPYTNGVAGAWTFTVNLANNVASAAVKLSNENLCTNYYQNNGSDAYPRSTYPRTTRLFKKLPDGRIIFNSLYSIGNSNSNYGAVAKIGYYNEATWNGFTESIAYEIPGSSFSSNTSIAPIFSEFAALDSTYYLSWCTKTNAQAKENGTVSSPASLVLRNLQTNVQVNVDSLLNTNSYVNTYGTFGNMLMQPYDIIAVPSSRQIYVVYTKFINFTGDFSSIDNIYGTFLKRYDSNLNLIDTSELFRFNPRSYGGALTSPSLGSPKFSFKVSNTGVLTLILSFGYALVCNKPLVINGDVIMTNVPSSNNNWTTVLNRTGEAYTSIYYPTEGRSIRSI